MVGKMQACLLLKLLILALCLLVSIATEDASVSDTNPPETEAATEGPQTQAQKKKFKDVYKKYCQLEGDVQIREKCYTALSLDVKIVTACDNKTYPSMVKTSKEERIAECTCGGFGIEKRFAGCYIQLKERKSDVNKKLKGKEWKIKKPELIVNFLNKKLECIEKELETPPA